MGESTGVWYDHDTHRVVRSRPRRGRQISAPGKPETENVARLVDLYGANGDTIRVEQATAPTDVETRAQVVDVSAMSKAELVAEAERRGVDVPARASKATLAELLG